jgi:hypothetical protein
MLSTSDGAGSTAYSATRYYTSVSFSGGTDCSSLVSFRERNRPT